MPRDVAVVFHGAFGVRFTKSNVEVYVPKISAHVNLFGAWENLRELEESVNYTLDGVPGNPGKLPEPDPESNVMFEKISKPEAGSYFCKITLPNPSSITSLRKEPIAPAK